MYWQSHFLCIVRTGFYVLAEPLCNLSAIAGAFLCIGRYTFYVLADTLSMY